jgi:preprotein translocase subunit YajC
MSRKESKKDTELNRLINDLENLKIQVKDITKRIEDLQGNTNHKKSDKHRGFEIGDKVIITNNYRNRKGITGNIVRITPAQVKIKPSNGNAEFHVYKQNIKRV